MSAPLKSVSSVLLSVAVILSLQSGINQCTEIPINKQLKVESGHHWRDCFVVLGLDWRTDPIKNIVDTRSLDRTVKQQLSKYGQYALHKATIREAQRILAMGNEKLRNQYTRDGLGGEYACAGRKVAEYKQDAMRAQHYMKMQSLKPAFAPPAGAVPIRDPSITYSAKLAFEDRTAFEMKAGVRLLIGTHKAQYKVTSDNIRALNKAIQTIIKHKKRDAAFAFIQIGDDPKTKTPIVGVTKERTGKIYMQAPKAAKFKKGEKKLLKEGSQITIFGELQSYTVGKSATDDASFAKLYKLIRNVYGKEGGFMTVIASDGKHSDFYYDAKKRVFPELKIRYFVDETKELTLKNKLICARDHDYWISVELDAYEHGFGRFYYYMMRTHGMHIESVGSQNAANTETASYEAVCKSERKELKCYLATEQNKSTAKKKQSAAHAMFLDELDDAATEAFLRGFEKGFRNPKYKH